ncbi:MAG: glycine cleavage system protein GcvH [Lachnospiraceae bacterium]|nr:glycine cleavage system protein GcvH [Lachnospiraceae bacterium]
MEYPASLRYSESHVWAKKEGDTVKLGVTDYAQDQLGDVLFVDLPEVGAEFSVGDAFTEIESSKTATEVEIPVSGEVVAVNNDLDDSPELINESPYDAWIIEINTDDDVDALMTAAEYKDHLD